MRVTGHRSRPRTVAIAGSLLVALLVGACATDAQVHSGPAVSLPVATDDVATVASTTSTTAAGNGPSGVGDSLFPDLGNPGIDVVHYDVELAYDPAVNHLEGTVTLDLRFTTALTSFSLDSAGPDVHAVTVDGRSAAFRQASPELFVTPAQPVTEPRSAQVKVTYSVDPVPTASDVGLSAGWFHTSGGSYVENEPDGARTWLPSNDHPSDKAGFTFRITVPAGLTAVANGALRSHTTVQGHEVWQWDESRPMATYLISLLTGKYDLVDGVGPHGLPLLHAVLHEDRAVMQPFLDVTAEQIAFFESQFGPYPLDRYGVSFSDSPSGLAMETQERSLFSRDDFLSGQLQSLQQLLLSHELAHQWFGDAVTPARWRDIWLNESFATYGQWMWLEHAGLDSVSTAAQRALSQRRSGSSADPTVDGLFSFNSYDGGAVILHALRLTIGDPSFFELLRSWAKDNNGESRTTQDFIALANKVAGRDLTGFFDTWLFADHLPTTFP